MLSNKLALEVWVASLQDWNHSQPNLERITSRPAVLKSLLSPFFSHHLCLHQKPRHPTPPSSFPTRQRHRTGRCLIQLPVRLDKILSTNRLAVFLKRFRPARSFSLGLAGTLSFCASIPIQTHRCTLQLSAISAYPFPAMASDSSDDDKPLVARGHSTSSFPSIPSLLA